MRTLFLIPFLRLRVRVSYFDQLLVVQKDMSKKGAEYKNVNTCCNVNSAE